MGFFEPEVAKPEAAELRPAVGLPAIPPLAGLPGLAGYPAMNGAQGYAGLPGLGGLPTFQSPQAMDPMAALSVLGSRRRPIRQVNTAKLLVGPGMAAAIDLPTYSFASTNFTDEADVSMVLASNSSDGIARFSLTFGYFPRSLYYDPTLYFSDTFDMELAASDASTLPTAAGGSALAGANCAPADDKCGKPRRGRNAANSAETMAARPLFPLGVSLLTVFGAVLLS